MNFRYTSFAFVVAGTLITSACGGGGSSSTPSVPGISQPPAPGAAPVSATQGPLVQSKFIVTVPRGSTSSALRRAQFVAASTQSVSVVLIPPSGTPAPPAVMNISATSPNCTSTSSALTCTLAVLAPAGNDAFTITTYDGVNATGNVLATGAVTGTVVANQANSFPVTLGGVPAKITLALSNAYLPAGVSGTTTLTVQAYDADANTIVGTYATPIGLSGSHLTFVPASVTQSGPVTVTFDGAATTVLAIKASGGAVSAATNLTPTSNVVKYPIPSGTANPFQIAQGPDGNIYFGEYGPTAPLNNGSIGGSVPKIGQLNPATGTVSELPLNYSSPVGLYFTSDGALWVAEEGNLGQGAVARITPFSTAGLDEQPVPIPSSTPQQPRYIAQRNGSLYVSEYYGSTISVIAPPAAGFTIGPNSHLYFGNAAFSAAPRGFQGIALGSDGNLWVAESGIQAFGKVTSYALGAATMTDYPMPVPTSAAAGTYCPETIAAGSDGNLYVTAASDGSGANVPYGLLFQLTTSGAYTNIPMPTVNDGPYIIQPGASGTLYFSDFGAVGGIGKLTTGGQVWVWPVATIQSNPIDTPQGITVASDGSIWYTEAAPFGGTNGVGYNVAENDIGHLILAAGWTVYPQALTIGVGALAAQEIGMAESGDSSPFTVTSLNPSICTTTALTGFSHNFLITGVAPGTCSVTITDKNKRVVTQSVTVTSTTIVVQSQRRSATRGHGYGGF